MGNEAFQRGWEFIALQPCGAFIAQAMGMTSEPTTQQAAHTDPVQHRPMWTAMTPVHHHTTSLPHQWARSSRRPRKLLPS